MPRANDDSAAQRKAASGAVVASRVRLGKDERRDGLIDAAAAIAESSGLDEVTIEAVAAHAGVSRPLIYKHFANRDELLAALYRREAVKLHRLLAGRVGAAHDLEGMFDALVHGSLQAAAEQGPMLAALRSAGGWTRQVRREQRSRDLDTSKAFARRARREGLDPEKAGPATAMLLSLIDSALSQWRAKPTPERATLLAETYMVVVRSTLGALRTPSSD